MSLLIAILTLFFTGTSQAATHDFCNCEVFHKTGAHLAVAYLKGTTVKEDENGNTSVEVEELAKFSHHDKKHYFTPEVVNYARHLCQASMVDYIKNGICPKVRNTR